MRARERILDAVEELLTRSGFSGINVRAVAAEAGVSRQTVYTQFGTREELLSQTVIRLNARVLAEISSAIDGRPDPGEYLVEFLVAVRTAFRAHRVLGTLLFRDHGSPLFEDDMMARARPVAGVLLDPLLKRAPQLAGREDDVFELVLRLGVSLLLFESENLRSDGDLRAFLQRTLLPALSL